MWRALVVGAGLLASCEQEERLIAERLRPPPGPILDVDPCAAVTQADAAALFGKPAIQQPGAPGECIWGCDCDFTDGSRLVLRASFQRSSALRPFFPQRDIHPWISTQNINGRPVGGESLRVHIETDNNLDLELDLHADGGAVPSLETKREDIRRLGEALRARMNR